MTLSGIRLLFYRNEEKYIIFYLKFYYSLQFFFFLTARIFFNRALSILTRGMTDIFEDALGFARESRRWREKTRKRRLLSDRRGSAFFPNRATLSEEAQTITIRLSPSTVLLQSGYQLSNPLISMHSIYVRLSRPTRTAAGITISRCEKARARASRECSITYKYRRA